MKTLLMLILSIFIAQNSWANAKVIGNGGNTVVCKNDQDKVVSAEIFDLYEGRVLRGHTYQENSMPAYQQALQYADKISLALGNNPSSPDSFSGDLKKTIRNLIFLPPGTGLKPIPDGNEFIVPKGCTITQTANRLDLNHIYIDSDIWALLSEAQKAALLLHEELYIHYQEVGSMSAPAETDSVRTRATVSYLFSGGTLEKAYEIPKEVQKKSLICLTEDAWENGRAATRFLAYPGDDGRLVVQFILWADHNIVTKTSLRSLPQQISSWPLASGSVVYVNGELISPIDRGIQASVKFDQPMSGNIYFPGKSPGENIEVFNCRFNN